MSIYLLWLCVWFLLLGWAFCNGEQGLFSTCGAQAAHLRGFSGWGARALGHVAW